MKYELLGWLPLFICSRAVPTIQGGSNSNDRTTGGAQGEPLLTGAMVVSHDGQYIMAQRNQTSVLVDVTQLTAHELSTPIDRFVFARTGERAYAALADRRTVVAYDLKTRSELWKTAPPFASPTGATLERLSDDDQFLLLGDEDCVHVLDSQNGKELGRADIGSVPTELSFVPGTQTAIILGTTRWNDHRPQTDLMSIDLASRNQELIVVPNCSAPIMVTPEGTRAFISPTFCEEGASSSGKNQWTNPDPVSVVDVSLPSLRFVENLPGFGPVAMDTNGTGVIAYLDVERMDASLFKDATQVPSTTGPRYYIMVIDPVTLDFGLSPIGDLLPRFVLSKDGHTLVVDATVQQIRGEAKVTATMDNSGNFTVSFKLFGSVNSQLGLFDTVTDQYQSLSGAAARLDRLVQLTNATQIYTLKMTTDGMGGDLYRIDLAKNTAQSLGTNLRDIGLLADGETLVLRERLPAAQVQSGTGSAWYRRERFCLSLNGLSCESSVVIQDSTPFQSGPKCTSYHDC